MRNEIENLFGDGKHRSIIERHQRRTTWVSMHLKEILLWLNIESALSKKWKVMPLIVTDIELMTPFLRKSKINIISILELEKRISKTKA
jgi:hypothetical protein